MSARSVYNLCDTITSLFLNRIILMKKIYNATWWKVSKLFYVNLIFVYHIFTTYRVDMIKFLYLVAHRLGFTICHIFWNSILSNKHKNRLKECIEQTCVICQDENGFLQGQPLNFHRWFHNIGMFELFKSANQFLLNRHVMWNCDWPQLDLFLYFHQRFSWTTNKYN